jgi:hypothetical protein
MRQVAPIYLIHKLTVSILGVELIKREAGMNWRQLRLTARLLYGLHIVHNRQRDGTRAENRNYRGGHRGNFPWRSTSLLYSKLLTPTKRSDTTAIRVPPNSQNSNASTGHVPLRFTFTPSGKPHWYYAQHMASVRNSASLPVGGWVGVPFIRFSASGRRLSDISSKQASAQTRHITSPGDPLQRPEPDRDCAGICDQFTANQFSHINWV